MEETNDLDINRNKLTTSFVDGQKQLIRKDALSDEYEGPNAALWPNDDHSTRRREN